MLSSTWTCPLGISSWKRMVKCAPDIGSLRPLINMSGSFASCNALTQRSRCSRRSCMQWIILGITFLPLLWVINCQNWSISYLLGGVSGPNTALKFLVNVRLLKKLTIILPIKLISSFCESTDLCASGNKQPFNSAIDLIWNARDASLCRASNSWVTVSP